MMQVSPDGDYTQEGIRFNLRTEGRSFALGPERSGLYFFHADGEAGGFAAMPWVVAPARPVASIAVIASTNTWNAYNNFGGRSNCIHPEGLPPQPTVNARLDNSRYHPSGAYQAWGFPNDRYPPLSFDRPEPMNAPRRGEQATDRSTVVTSIHWPAPSGDYLPGWSEKVFSMTCTVTLTWTTGR
jgi:hypothetical protein